MPTGPPVPTSNDGSKIPPRFSRSPHPYYRQSLDVPDRIYSNRVLAPAPQSSSIDKSSAQDHRPGTSPYFDFDGRKRRKETTSPSDSGTEADDERPLLRALKAPPLRPRKGLKDHKGTDSDPLGSPNLTPSPFEEERNRLLAGHAFQERRRGKPIPEADSAKAKEKQRRRGRAEYTRRALETVLLGVSGYLSCRGSPLDIGREILCHLTLVLAVYSSYLVQLLWYGTWGSSPKFWLQKIRFPATADPALLLYPLLLPLFAVLSLRTKSLWVMLANLSLSLSCIPIQAIPLNDTSVQWLLSLAPLVYGRSTDMMIFQSLDFKIPSLATKRSTEFVTLLFPLHNTLVSCLGFLSTTSLLPTELQLLSVSLINILMFSSTPQSVILKSLLWMGGLSMFVFCRRVLHWSVGLARVPSWRFRRVHHRSLEKSPILRAIDDTLGGWLSRKFSSRAGSDDSASGDDLPPLLRRQRSVMSTRMYSVDGTVAKGFDKKEIQNLSTTDDINYYGHKSPKEEGLFSDNFRQRRHTLPTSPTALPNIPELTKSATAALSKLRNNRRPFLSLTRAQAKLLKWIYAFYTYTVVISIILVPIRVYVGKYALKDNEPIGWALGYLFGDISSFRFRVILWNLERWIPVPSRLSDPKSPLCFGEHLRLEVLGAANTRLVICAYCVATIAAGLLVVFQLSAVVEVDTRRKVFHGMMVVMFLPTIFIDPTFVALAFALILAIFLLLDLFRASQLPPLSKPLTYFLAPYVDGRDHRGPIIVSHIFLLIGCAIPLWLSLASTERAGHGPLAGWEVATRDLSMVSGVICVGMGDAAASLVGRRFGRRRWPWSGGKSLEGSAAFAVAVVAGIATSRTWMLLGGWDGDTGDGWSLTLAKAAAVAAGASLTEAVLTGGNDNVIVPVVLWLLMRGFGI